VRNSRHGEEEFIVPIDPERMRSIEAAIDRNVESTNDVAQSVIKLWRSRIDMALAMDDEEALRETVRGPGGEVAIWDNNTNCSGCGGGGTAHWA
jgi:hypothetical protein